MCGIAGGAFWGHRVDRSRAVDAVTSMVQQLTHRGPDGHGVVTSPAPRDGSDIRPYAVLGHTRLAIIDVSSAGAQPMGSPDGHWVAFNGEIYNFAELRRELEARGVSFCSHSDTEVILRGYAVWGLDLLPRLRGMFAFALWDATNSRLVIARDRLGIKPVYVHRDETHLMFSSEVRALLASGLVSRQLDHTAVWQYLGYQTFPAPRTLVAGVRALPPASWLTVDGKGHVEQGTYWRMLDPHRPTLDVSPSSATAMVADALRSSVTAHLVSDVPVAAFLSGGIDSSAIVALMHEAGVTPRTFSVGFDEQAFDESPHAALIAQRFSTEHTHIRLSAAEALAQLPSALQALDQPSGDAVNTYVVSAAVHQHGVKVALSGLGGDEVFGGYPSFRRLARTATAGRLWRRTPSALRRLAGAATRTLGGRTIAAGKTAALLESSGQVAEMFPVMRQLLSPQQRETLLTAHVLTRIDSFVDPYVTLLGAAYDEAPRASTFEQVSFAESRTYMHDLLLRDTDQMSMAHALEVRVPLLDHSLIELVMSLPDSAKIPTTTPKGLLVHALDGLLPDSIVHRPKQGFALPIATWMRGPMKQFCADRLGERGLAGRGLCDPRALTTMWRTFLDGDRRVSWSRIWMLVALDAWLERHSLTV